MNHGSFLITKVIVFLSSFPNFAIIMKMSNLKNNFRPCQGLDPFFLMKETFYKISQRLDQHMSFEKGLAKDHAGHQDHLSSMMRVGIVVLYFAKNLHSIISNLCKDDNTVLST